MDYVEEFDTEKYNTIESIESLFQRINRFGNVYNDCFGCFVPNSGVLSGLGIFGAIIEKVKDDHITGYFVNKYEREICLIPLIVDDHKKIQINLYGYIDIKYEDIKEIKIRTEDFKFKRIKIILKDQTKYIMVTSKKLKGIERHAMNLNHFVESCKKEFS